MTKKKPTAAETKADLENKVTELCAKEIEDILVKNKRALQPYQVVGEFGTYPRVRLVVNEQKDGEEK